MLFLSSADFVLKLSNTIFLLLSYKKVENGITNHAFNSSVKYDFIDVSIFLSEKEDTAGPIFLRAAIALVCQDDQW